MDPDANLAEQQRLTAYLQGQLDHGNDLDEDRVGRLLELVEGLNQWIARGGALPSAWENARGGEHRDHQGGTRRGGGVSSSRSSRGEAPVVGVRLPRVGPRRG